MDGSHSLLFRSDSSLALRCRKGAIHPIIQSPRRRGRAASAVLSGRAPDAWREAFENAQRLLPRPTQPDASAGRLLPIHVVAYPPDACWLHLALPAIPRRPVPAGLMKSSTTAFA